MKKIYLNLKRFDIPQSFGGINKDKENETYGAKIAGGIEKMNLSLPVTIYFQESLYHPLIKLELVAKAFITKMLVLVETLVLLQLLEPLKQ